MTITNNAISKRMKMTTHSPARYVAAALFITGTLLMCGRPARAQQPQQAFVMPLSPAARVSLITYGAGNDDISSVFGHTEIRIVDPALGIDRDYSYGGFDYQADNFVLKFLRGTLPYRLDVHALSQVAWYYQQYNRSIREQSLDLSAPQRQRLYTALETNYLPQNRKYRYKFFYDNCATRPRDMIAQAMGDSLVWATTVQQPTKSYRAWMNDYLTQRPWEQLGMNLAIGRPADKVTTGWEAMYLPDNVFNELAKAQVRLPSGQLKPIVTQTQTLFAGQPLFKSTLPIVLYPDFVMLVLLLLVAWLTWWHWNTGIRAGNRHGYWLDRVLFSFSGFWGWFLFLLWFATDHGVTAWNPTLLWMMPLHLPGIFWATSPKRHPFQTGTYFRITTALLILSFFFLNAPGAADNLLVGTFLVRALFRSWPQTNAIARRADIVRA